MDITDAKSHDVRADNERLGRVERLAHDLRNAFAPVRLRIDALSLAHAGSPVADALDHVQRSLATCDALMTALVAAVLDEPSDRREQQETGHFAQMRTTTTTRASTDTAEALSILWIDDNTELLRALADHLRLSAHATRVDVATSVDEGITLSATFDYSLLLVDWEIGTMTAPTIIRSIQQTTPQRRCAVYSGTSNVAHVEEALRAGASGFLHKSLAPDALVAGILSLARGERVVAMGGW